MNKQLAVSILLVLGACADFGRQPNYYSVNHDGTRSKKYARVNEYTSYQGVGQQEAVATAFDAAEHAPVPALEVEVWNSALPPGVTIANGTLTIAPGAPYEALGKFELGYWLSSAPVESEIHDELVRLAAVTHGNAVVVEVQRVAHGDPRVEFVQGVVLRKKSADGAPGAMAERGGGGANGDDKAALAVLAVKKPARKQVALAYRASVKGCLTAEEFADEVSAKLGYSPWVASASGGASETIDVTMAADGKAGVRATVKLAKGAKELAGASCKLATDAAVSAIVVRLE